MSDMVERVARAICNEVNDQPYEALPEAATYLERKTHVDRAILDRREARQVARAAIGTMMESITPAMIDSMEEMYMPFGEMRAAWDGAFCVALHEEG